MNSKQKLSLALLEAKAPQYMIERAETGYYSDFESELDMPCVTLVNDLKKIGLNELAHRAIAGEFDATKQESDEWFEKEGKDLMKEFGLGGLDEQKTS